MGYVRSGFDTSSIRVNVLHLLMYAACYDLDYIIIYDFIYCSSHVHLEYTPGDIT